MPKSENPNMTLEQMVAVTAELTGARLSELAAFALVKELRRYPLDEVGQALARCRLELKGRLTLSDVLDRLLQYPSADEAWAGCPKSEAETVVWSTLAAEAHAVAWPLIQAGDMVAARRAFIEAYEDRCAKARARGERCKWTISLGYDKGGRAPVIAKAVEEGKLSPKALMAFPHLLDAPEVRQALGLPTYDDEPVTTGITDGLTSIKALIGKEVDREKR